jgi:hypothetical protein
VRRGAIAIPCRRPHFLPVDCVCTWQLFVRTVDASSVRVDRMDPDDTEAYRLVVDPRREPSKRPTPPPRCPPWLLPWVGTSVQEPHPSVLDVLWDVGPVPEPWEVILESLVAMNGKSAAPMRRRIQLAIRYLQNDQELKEALTAVRFCTGCAMPCFFVGLVWLGVALAGWDAGASLHHVHESLGLSWVCEGGVGEARSGVFRHHSMTWSSFCLQCPRLCRLLEMRCFAAPRPQKCVSLPCRLWTPTVVSVRTSGAGDSATVRERLPP